MKVVITKELGPLWGVEDIIAEGLPKDQTNEAIIELLNEDLVELLDNAEWQIIYD